MENPALMVLFQSQETGISEGISVSIYFNQAKELCCLVNMKNWNKYKKKIKQNKYKNKIQAEQNTGLLKQKEK